MKNMLLGIVCLGVLCAVGCRFPFSLSPAEVESGPSQADLKQYRQAVTAYRQEAYPEAAKDFESIRRRTKDKRFAQMALYGLACSRLIMAKSPREYNDAIALWREWVESAPKKYAYENPVMVDALINEKMLFSNLPLTPGQSKEIQQEPMVSRWLLIKSKEELDRLREELKIARESLDKRKKMIQSRDKRIGELTRKIKALETIDQKIQKKKNAIPSADTGTSR